MMNCKKLGEKCNSERCPMLQYLIKSRRFDNWEAMFESCKHLDAKHDAEDDIEDEFDPIDEIIESEEEAG